MARPKASLLTDLTTADLKRMLVARERIDVLEKEKAKLEKSLGAIEKELSRLLRDATGPQPRRKTVRRKPARKKTVAKKTTRRKTTRVAVTKKNTRGGGKVTLEDVVAAVITKNKGPLSFKELYAAIVQGKLFKSKSSNFDNVLRRTLSTSKKVKRVSRGIYDVA